MWTLSFPRGTQRCTRDDVCAPSIPTLTPNSWTKLGSKPSASEQSRNVGPLNALAAGAVTDAITAISAAKPTGGGTLRITLSFRTSLITPPPARRLPPRLLPASTLPAKRHGRNTHNKHITGTQAGVEQAGVVFDVHCVRLAPRHMRGPRRRVRPLQDATRADWRAEAGTVELRGCDPRRLLGGRRPKAGLRDGGRPVGHPSSPARASVR